MTIPELLWQHRRSWGIYIFALWSSVLALLAFTNLLLLSKAVELYGYQTELQYRLWVVVILNFVFGLGFAGSAYGLWRRRNWGRLTFLWLIVIWSAFNIVSLILSPGNYLVSGRIVNSLRFIIAPVISLLYLNLGRVKSIFIAAEAGNSLIEEEEIE